MHSSILQSNISTNTISNKNYRTALWMGELEPWMDENFIRRVWVNLNINVIVKVIRDKLTFTSSGYAFIDFGSISAAQCALDMFNGQIIPNTSCTFKLNWPSGGGLVDRKEDRQPEYSIFVGDLVTECTEQMLLNIFQSRYMSCKSVRIMRDPRTGRSRGYGFIRFLHQQNQIQAVNEMQGFIIGNRSIRVSLATPKTHHTDQQLNTTVFVGGLSCPISEHELKQYFSIFGDIVYVRIPPGKGCGFVQFVLRHSAELAIEQMNGYQIGSSRIRLSWGQSQQQQKKNHLSTFSSSLFLSSSARPFEEERCFMTVFNSNDFINLDSSTVPSPTITTKPTSNGRHTSSWSKDYHHIFAQ